MAFPKGICGMQEMYHMVSKRGHKVKPKESFKNMYNENERLVDQLQKKYGLKRPLIYNIVAFAKCLLIPGEHVVSETSFMTQLYRQFDIADRRMLTRIYELFKENSEDGLSVRGLACCICTFLTKNLDIQARFVFEVYDMNKDGSIEFRELLGLLTPAVMTLKGEMEEYEDDDESAEHMKDLMLMLADLLGLTVDADLSYEHFLARVKEDNLILQTLGKCLPHKSASKSFVDKIKDKSPEEVKVFFEEERNGMTFGYINNVLITKKKHYPIRLHLP